MKHGRRTYDLVVTDIKMPVLDGEHFDRELERRLPAHRRPRVIFLTDFLEGTGPRSWPNPSIWNSFGVSSIGSSPDRRREAPTCG